MTDTDHYVQVIVSALEELHAAISALVEDTQPSVPMPRPRRFELAPEIVWPKKEDELFSISVVVGGWWQQQRRLTFGEKELLAKDICRACGYQPRQILRALRRIQAAAAWCRARAEGRRRAAQEILRQQQEAHEVLEAEAALLALRA